jgi:alkylhydroperoxidase family enzyme
MQAKDALSALRADERFPLVGVWGHAPICSERERAALVCGDELTLLAEHDVPDTLHESVRTGFSGDELCSLTLVTSTVRRWDRFADAFRAPVGNYVARADAAQH